MHHVQCVCAKYQTKTQSYNKMSISNPLWLFFQHISHTKDPKQLYYIMTGLFSLKGEGALGPSFVRKNTQKLPCWGTIILK